VTVNSAVNGPAVRVMIPVRGLVVVLAVAVARSTPASVPEVGLIDSHGLVEVTTADQDARFVATVVWVVPPAAGTEPVVGFGASHWLAPVWVTVNVAVCDPAVTVTIPVREAVEGLTAALARSTPLLTPAAGLADSHPEPERIATVHDAAVVVTVVCVVPPAPGIVPAIGFNDNAPGGLGRVAVTV
jgi:hypothetical protein